MTRYLAALGSVLLLGGPLLAARQAPPPAPTPATPTTTQPPRDGAARPATAPATASMTGQITAAAGGQPLHRVRVTLTGSIQNPLTAVTDDRGEYEMTGVPTGSYSLTAARAGYLTVQYGQRRPRESGRRIDVPDGQTLNHMDIALMRGAVLAGRITDELGEPYPGVRVEALEPRFINGRRASVPAGIDTTDDIGEFRISGLQPGVYTLGASTIETWEGDGDKPETYAYAMTYFPGTSGTDRAEAVTLAVGQEVAHLDFALSVSRAVRVSGRVENANGDALPGQPVNLSKITRTIGGALLSSGPGPSGRTRPDGTFEIVNVPHGEYLIISTLSSTESVTQTLMIAGNDIKDIVLTPRRSSTVSGLVVTDEGTPPTFPAARLQIAPIAADGSALPLWDAPRPQTVRPDWSFSFANIDGLYVFRVVGLPQEWMVKSVKLNDRDITDTPLDIPKGGRETPGVQIVLSRKGATLTGDVVDAHGAPLADSTVVVFAEDRALWGAGTRFVRSVRPDNEGNFSIGSLPAATYLVIAREFIPDGQWEDFEFLQSLTLDAVRIQLPEGATVNVSLKVEVHQ